MRKAVWKKGNKKLTGSWYYNWAGDYFHIILDIEGKTGSINNKFASYNFKVYGEHPEFNGWKLQL